MNRLLTCLLLMASALPAHAAADPDPASLDGRISAVVTGFFPQAAAAVDLSPVRMFLDADIVVKLVMLSLMAASLISWALFIGKSLQLAAGRIRLGHQMRLAEKAASLEEIETLLRASHAPLAAMASASLHEWRQTAGNAPVDDRLKPGLRGRAASRIGRLEARAVRDAGRGTAVLATIGSISPFVGLFGTVWGIMNAFVSIARSQTTNLAVVAPGIAEALLATAIGLVAAIPAVVFYNQLARSLQARRALLADAAALIDRQLSRDLDLEDRRRLDPVPFLKAAE